MSVEIITLEALVDCPLFCGFQQKYLLCNGLKFINKHAFPTGSYVRGSVIK